MNTTHRIIAGLIASAALVLAATPAIAASVDVNVVMPGAIVQPVYMPRPDYVQPRYESDWRERQARALAWQNDSKNRGQAVSAAAHARNDARKDRGSKSHKAGNSGHKHGK